MIPFGIVLVLSCACATGTPLGGNGQSWVTAFKKRGDTHTHGSKSSRLAQIRGRGSPAGAAAVQNRVKEVSAVCRFGNSTGLPPGAKALLAAERIVRDARQPADDGNKEGRRYHALDLRLAVAKSFLQIACPQRHAVLHPCALPITSSKTPHNSGAVQITKKLASDLRLAVAKCHFETSCPQRQCSTARLRSEGQLNDWDRFLFKNLFCKLKNRATP